VVATLLTPASGAHAELVRIGLNGARPSQLPLVDTLLAYNGFTQTGWLQFASQVGENWLPGLTAIAVDYPAQIGLLSGLDAVSADRSTAIGRVNLDAAIRAQLALGNTVAVAGLSEGSLVVDAEIAYLATDPVAPPANSITFYVFGDQNRGVGVTYPVQGQIPIFGFTLRPAPDSQYDVVVVVEEWDGWANPPDRPWNLLADLNALMGAIVPINSTNDHSKTALDSLSQAVQVSKTTSSLGGTTTTYMVYEKQLPLTKPLRAIGIPSWIVDKIDSLLMPLIEAGYSSLTPNLGPHIENGKLVFTTSPKSADAAGSLAVQGLTAGAAEPAVQRGGIRDRRLTPTMKHAPGASEANTPAALTDPGAATTDIPASSAVLVSTGQVEANGPRASAAIHPRNRVVAGSGALPPSRLKHLERQANSTTSGKPKPSWSVAATR
jgi:hypothetical protein